MERQVNISEVMDRSGVRFGTSGARGLVADMSDEVCFAYGAAFLQAVGQGAGPVALACDLRPSSPGIAAAVAAAVRAAGGEVDYCGAIPTPALAFYAQQQRRPGVMVTGSHIPFDRNGIKFYRVEGEITKADEAAIAAATVALPATVSVPLPAVNAAALAGYVARYVDFFPAGCLKGMRLAVYEHSSVARDVLRTILEALGAEVLSLGRTDVFVPIDTEAVSAADAAQARAWAAEHGFDAIISTDGDADRPLLGDETGTWLRGDIVGVLCAQFLGAQGVVTTVSANSALERCGAFAQVRRTRIGSPFVIAGMEALAAVGVQRVVGFEPNGGFLVGSGIERDGRVLAPLPTRDAVLPVLALLCMARERGVKLSALPAGLPARFTASDRLQQFPTELSKALVAELAGSHAAVAALLDGLCGPVQAQDETDGLRLTLEGGDVVHLRPSGNAPELRCYTEADTPARAEALVAACLERLRARAG